jgi:hypothetical protein
MGPFILMAKSPVIVFLQITESAFFLSNCKTKNANDLPINSVAQGNLVALLLANLKGPRRVLTGVSTADNVVVGSAEHVISGEPEGQLWVAVDGDVEEMGDGDGEKGGSGELHVDGWSDAEVEKSVG